MTCKILTCGVITLLCMLTFSACGNTDTGKAKSESTSASTTVQDSEAIPATDGNYENDYTSQEDNIVSKETSYVSDSQTDCSNSDITDDTIIIEDQVFTTMVQEIYTNSDKYIGRTIKLTGLFDKYHDDQTDKTYFSVYRKDEMGCCSYGIEVDWDDSTEIKIPSQDQIVTATGVLDKYTENSKEYLILHLSELDQSDE